MPSVTFKECTECGATVAVISRGDGLNNDPRHEEWHDRVLEYRKRLDEALAALDELTGYSCQ